jgi:hypothetical protein
MACLDNLLGIKSECTDTTPTVSLYIDSLVTSSEMEKFYDAPHETVKAMFDDKLNDAINVVKNDVYSQFTGNYITHSVIDSKRVGIYDERNAASDAIAATYKGLEIKMDQSKSSLKLVISSIKFYGNHTGNIDVKIFNTLTGETLATETIAAVAGEVVEAFTNYEYSGNLEPMFIGVMYDSTGVDAYKSTVGLTGCTSCSDTAYNQVNSYLGVRAVNNSTGSSVVQSNLTGTADTGGLSIVYSVECDHKGWMCNQKNVLAMPVLYKTAELLMEYALFNSSRFNDHSTNRDKYVERQMMYKDKYDETMKGVLNNMVLPVNDICLKCERTNRLVTSFP